MAGERPIGLGCMRLSTVAERDEDGAVAVLHAALDAGATLLDTADAYCLDERDVGHNERLVASALRSWSGDRSRVRVATKGGLRRPGGRWVPDGRARHLVSACEASATALDVDCLDLYQLHTPDPRTPLATSMRALARLQRDGLIRKIGLCNVSLGQLREACAIAPVSAVQVELSVFADDALRNRLLEHCRDEGISVIAHTPLGGRRRIARLRRDPALREIAAGHGSTSEEIALAWLRDLAPVVIPIPGATRPETARSAVRGQRLSLSAEDRAALEERIPAGRLLRAPRRDHRPAAESAGEVVLLMGYPAAGKSTAAEEWTARGYQRLNRDQRGGRLADLAPVLDAGLRAGERRFVLDNTWATRASRSRIVEVAGRHDVAVRCVWLDTSLEDVQINAVQRMLVGHGRLLGPEEMAQLGRRDPALVPPRAQFDYRRAFEPPEPDEGFSRIEKRTFERKRDPRYAQRALIVEVDGVLRRSRSGARSPATPDDVELLPGRAEVLRRYRDEGWLLLGLGWQPEVEEGTRTAEAVDRCFAHTNEELGLAIDVAFCPHRAGPPRCWCRRPLPGLGLVHIEAHRLDPDRCLFVGRSPTDRTFAKRLGFPYAEPHEVFA